MSEEKFEPVDDTIVDAYHSAEILEPIELPVKKEIYDLLYVEYEGIAVGSGAFSEIGNTSILQLESYFKWGLHSSYWIFLPVAGIAITLPYALLKTFSKRFQDPDNKHSQRYGKVVTAIKASSVVTFNQGVLLQYVPGDPFVMLIMAPIGAVLMSIPHALLDERKTVVRSRCMPRGVRRLLAHPVCDKTIKVIKQFLAVEAGTSSILSLVVIHGLTEVKVAFIVSMSTAGFNALVETGFQILPKDKLLVARVITDVVRDCVTAGALSAAAIKSIFGTIAGANGGRVPDYVAWIVYPLVGAAAITAVAVRWHIKRTRPEPYNYYSSEECTQVSPTEDAEELPKEPLAVEPLYAKPSTSIPFFSRCCGKRNKANTEGEKLITSQPAKENTKFCTIL
ncbi:MAG: hypothetical protein M3R00_05045 [Pseudomonadota bacterium]|nr:hypothetical protein [Pseudomonadota bacterium]